jgi:prolyl oligopeptidase
MRIAQIALCIFALGFTSYAQAGPNEDFHALLDEAWEWQLRENPMMASGLGDRRYNDQWSDNSIAAIQRRQDETREFLRRAYAIDRSALSENDQLNHELFRRSLQDRVDRFKFSGHLIPFYQRGGVQNLDSNTSRLRFVTVKDYEDWIARLGQIDAVIGQTIDLADAGIEAGLVSPRVLMERIPKQIAAQLVDAAESSPFYKVFEEMPNTITAENQERLRAQAREVIEETVLPAYRELDEYFNDTYLPASRDTIGLSELPNGSEWYELRARQFTTTQMSPDEIHRVGLNEVARIRGEMQKIIDELDFGGSFQDFLTFLRTDPQFYFDNPDDLYQAYLATSKRIDPELVNLFGTLPRMT